MAGKKPAKKSKKDINPKVLKAELERLKKENARLAATTASLNENLLELYTLYHISRTLSMSLQIQELFDLAMKSLVDYLKIQDFTLMLYDEKSASLVIRASHGFPGEVAEPGMVIVEKGISWKVFEKGKPVMIPDISKEKDFFYFPESGIRKGSFLGVPLLGRDGKVIGVLNAHKKEPAAFNDKELRLFQAVAEHVAVAVENAIAFQRQRELVNRDDLTELYNRRYFFERLEREVYRSARYGRPLSLLMIDIDHFKRYNDTYGHLRGDEALKRLALILKSNIRQSDVVARYGGEEFLIMLPETPKHCALAVAEKLRRKVEEVDFNDDTLDLARAGLTITVGISAMPEDAKEAKTLVDLADKALYFGKARGRNQVCSEVPPGEAKHET